MKHRYVVANMLILTRKPSLEDGDCLVDYPHANFRLLVKAGIRKTSVKAFNSVD
jgi:hypothetical protein